MTRFRYSVDDTSVDSEVPNGDGTTNVMINVGNVSREHPVYAVAVDRHGRLSPMAHGRLSPMARGTFTVSVICNPKGRVLDAITWLPVEVRRPG